MMPNCFIPKISQTEQKHQHSPCVSIQLPTQCCDFFLIITKAPCIWSKGCKTLLSSTSWTQVAIQVTRRTACAVIGESLLRQNCSHGSLFLSESAASKSVFDRTSGEHLQYAVCRSITSFRAASRASGSLSFNCAAASWMSGSIPYCLIPSAPWKTLS